MKNKKNIELATSHFSDCQICPTIFGLRIYHLDFFEALIQRGFWIIRKITIAN